MQKVIVICGPTASGKTALSIELAKRINGEIVSADSMQIYDEMSIGTAKPDAEEMQGIKHYLVGNIAPTTRYSVSDYKNDATKALEEIIEKNKTPIVVGGTGLYVNSLIYGIDYPEVEIDLEYKEISYLCRKIRCMEYKNRIADQLLRDKLEAMGAVLIEGPKACGKTTTAEQQAKSVIYMDDPTKQQQYRQMAQTNISFLLEGETPRLIDEWQEVPQFWDAIRFEVDHRDEDGQFMLTGSAVPVEAKEIHHTGTGRYGWLTMRPMSLWESGDSTGEISLSELFLAPDKIGALNKLTLPVLAFVVCRGGWPKALQKKTEKAALLQATEYYKAITNSDISRVDNVKRDAERAKSIMRSYARHQGSQASIATILADISTNEPEDVSDETIDAYLTALRKIFVIEDMPAWNPNLRSKTAVRTSDTRYYVDPSVGVAALGLGPNDLINDLNTFGLFFETMCIRDLRVYADALDGSVYHYRDKNGLECDAVVHLRNGSYGLIEIKLGGEKLIEDGAKTLMALSNIIDTSRMKAPAFCMVLTGVGDFAYKRTDGVYVVPIGCLKN